MMLITSTQRGRLPLLTYEGDVRELDQRSVRTANFKSFNRDNIDPEIRIFGKNASVAQDLEPEYITITDDSKTAWVSLQENNALAKINIEQGRVLKLYALGYQDHSKTNNALDASDKDNTINIRAWPVKGIYQPDSIANYTVAGKTYIVTANEGDARNYAGHSEVRRIADLALDENLMLKGIKRIEQLGRLKVSNIAADSDGNGRIDTLYSFGSRSFSIWNQEGVQVYDSASEFARITARDYPLLFNKGDKRSDDKGSEPEALTLGKIGHSIYAFIGLERTGGIMVYNITKPEDAFFVDYINTIDPQLKPSAPNAGDIAPEGLAFVNAKDSPTGKPFLISANEVSGTVSIYQIETVARTKE